MPLPQYILPEIRKDVLEVLTKASIPALCELDALQDNLIAQAESDAHSLLERAFTAIESHKNREGAVLMAARCAVLESLPGCAVSTIIRSRQYLSTLYGRLGRLSEAAALAESTLGEAQQVLGADARETLDARNQFAESCCAIGQLAQAIELHEENLLEHIRVLDADALETTTVRNNLAATYAKCGAWDFAIGLHEENLRERVRLLGPHHFDTLTSRNNLASTYEEAGMLDAAIGMHEDNLLECKQMKGHAVKLKLTVRSNLAMAYARAGRLDEAIELYEENLQERVDTLGVSACETLVARNNLAVAYVHAGYIGRGVAVFEHNLRERLRVLGREHPATILSSTNLAQALVDCERFSDAAPLLEEALASAEHLRQDSGDSFGRSMSSNFMQLETIAFLLAAVRTRLARPVQLIVEAIERGTARSILDLLQKNPKQGIDTAREFHRQGKWKADRLAAYEELLHRLENVERLAEHQASSEPLPFSVSREIADLREQLAVMDRDLLPVACPKSLQEIQQEVHPGELLLLYGWCHLGVTCVVIPCATDGEAIAIALSEMVGQGDETPEELARLERAKIARIVTAAGKVRDALPRDATIADLYKDATEILDFVLPPRVRAAAGRASRVIVVASGPLHELPLDLLGAIAGVKELADKPVCTAPSGSIFAFLRQRGRGRTKRERGMLLPAIVGDPDFDHHGFAGLVHQDRSIGHLPAARVEAQQLASYFRHVTGLPIAPLLGKDATVSQVFAESHGKHVLHFAAHVILGGLTTPMSSAIVLSPGPRPDGGWDNGLLRVDTLLTTWANRLVRTDLVVLANCHSGRSVNRGDSRFGLPIALLNAGCQGVVASLWSVDDLATCLLMTRFYQNYLGHHVNIRDEPETSGRIMLGQRHGPGEPMGVFEALAEAKSWLRTLSAHNVNCFFSRHPLAITPRVVEAGGHEKRGGTGGTPLQKLLRNAEMKKRPPFEPVRFWGGFFVIGLPGE